MVQILSIVFGVTFLRNTLKIMRRHLVMNPWYLLLGSTIEAAPLDSRRRSRPKLI